VIAGPDAGKSRRLRGVRTVVGRSQDCDFRVADGSVSRHHLEVVVSDECVLLRDLGSGNGTRVNGQRIDERVLRDQDEIAIGRTRFRFVDELGPTRRPRRPIATPPSPSPSPPQARPAPPPPKQVLSAARAPAVRSGDRRTRLAIAAAAVLIAAAGGIGFAIRAVRTARLEKVNPALRGERRPEPAPAPAAAPVPPAPAADESARAVPEVPAVQPAPAPSAPLPTRAPATAQPNPQKKPAASAKRRKE
jgi:hypothetical protein